MIIILMGITGSGKTTIGTLLSKALDASFYDADDFHTQSNKQKMARGEALTDEDRRPWLEKLRGELEKWSGEKKTAVLACSALKQKYRDFLSTGLEIRWVYLKGDRELIRQRIEGRRGHFTSLSLLESQIQTLEEPPEAIVVDIRQTPSQIVRELVHQLKGRL